MSKALLSGVVASYRFSGPVNRKDFSGGIVGFIPQEEKVSEPSLHALPGRVIVRVVDRPTTIPGSTLAADSRYYYSPYIGTVLEIGDPMTDLQKILAKELSECTEKGHRVIFSPGSGIEFTTKEMRDVVGNRLNSDGERTSRFGWLAGLRIFRIEDFACTLIGGDELGGSDDVQ